VAEGAVDPLEALEAEAERAAVLLEKLVPADWARPTRCPPLTVHELAVHALRGAYRIVEMLAAPPPEDEPERDAITYYRYDPAAVGPGVVVRAREDAAARPALGTAREWREAWEAAVAAARAHWEENPVVRSPLGTIRLREYVRTRCVEVTVHAMDLRAALGEAPDPTPEGLAATADVLRGLLGADLRPLGVDDLRFTLVGTGRERLSEEERVLLGPLAEAFPLLT
jgi:uncharacterized protein (TIGR03083 family)